MIYLQLIGIKNKEYSAWKTNLLKAVDRSTASFHFKEVNEVDEIVLLNLNAVPALIINGKLEIEHHKHVPSKEEFASHIQKYFTKITTMKKIIVPTDFSSTAANAYKYATDLAASTESQIKLVHIFHPIIPDNNLVTPTEEEMINFSQKQLETFVEKLEISSPDIPKPKHIEKEVIIGLAADKLLNISQEKDTDFILMGTTGAGGFFESLLGTVSSTVSQNAHCPVWLIPPKASFNGIKNILYASNYESANKEMIDEIVNISTIFDANIHLVHVNENYKKGDWELEELLLEGLFKMSLPDFKIKMNTVQSDQVWTGLYKYAEKENIDLIVMATRHRSFWERIRHKSMTKEMILHAKVPLLVLHMNAE